MDREEAGVLDWEGVLCGGGHSKGEGCDLEIIDTTKAVIIFLVFCIRGSKLLPLVRVAWGSLASLRLQQRNGSALSGIFDNRDCCTDFLSWHAKCGWLPCEFVCSPESSLSSLRCAFSQRLQSSGCSLCSHLMCHDILMHHVLILCCCDGGFHSSSLRRFPLILSWQEPFRGPVAFCTGTCVGTDLLSKMCSKPAIVQQSLSLRQVSFLVPAISLCVCTVILISCSCRILVCKGLRIRAKRRTARTCCSPRRRSELGTLGRAARAYGGY